MDKADGHIISTMAG